VVNDKRLSYSHIFAIYNYLIMKKMNYGF